MKARCERRGQNQVRLFDRRSRPAGDAETRDSTANPLKSRGRRVGLGLASSGRVASTVEGDGPAASGRGEVGGSSDARIAYHGLAPQ